jgi:hypothetical protein
MSQLHDERDFGEVEARLLESSRAQAQAAIERAMARNPEPAAERAPRGLVWIVALLAAAAVGLASLLG